MRHSRVPHLEHSPCPHYSLSKWDYGGYPNTLIGDNLPLQPSGLTCPWLSGRIGAR
jgi:hypothetical protein